MEPGTECTLRMSWDDSPLPVEGDFLRSVPGGSCYRVESVRRSGERWNMRVTRLGRDAVQIGDEGVFAFEWNVRRRR